MNTDELREKTRDLARRHKASWIELGRHLFSVYKDKMFKGWGYLTFAAYCQKELAIKETTAAKLLRSYSFLEKEEPRLVRTEEIREEEPRRIPNFESVDLLRLAKNNDRIPTNEFAELREDVLHSSRDPKEVRAKVKNILEKHAPKETPEIKTQKRNTALKRLIGYLLSAKTQFESEDLLPDYLLKQMDALMHKLEDQLE